MESDIREVAESKLADLLREAEDIRAFLKVYDELSSDVKVRKPGLPSAIPPDDTGISSRQEIIEASRAALRASYPLPMQIGDIFDEITSKGIRIGGKQPKGNLSAKLSQPDDLIYVKDKGWYYQPAENEDGAPSSEAKARDTASVPGFLKLQPSPPRAQD